jgi:site-specific recombinase XerC
VEHTIIEPRGEPENDALLISPAGTRLIYCNVHATFAQLRTDAGLRPRSSACRPRIHDLRHPYAGQTLLD